MSAKSTIEKLALSVAEKVAPANVSHGIVVAVGVLVCVAGYLKAAQAHMVYSQGRVDWKKTAAQALADLERGAKERQDEEAAIAQARAQAAALS
jgi:predicted RecA/RadA family phage recombinase